jgi:hypothetical protein
VPSQLYSTIDYLVDKLKAMTSGNLLGSRQPLVMPVPARKQWLSISQRNDRECRLSQDSGIPFWRG